MKYLEGASREQIILFPERLDDLVTEDNPVRVIDVFVNQIDLKEQGFKKAKLNKTSPGAPCYSPESLLKLYIYGYFKKIRSSRKLMETCKTNIEAMWLLERLTPDFRTISDFRKDNIKAIKAVFKAFVKICAELGLYNTQIGVQDGSKFRAVNSKDNNVTEAKLQKKLELAEEKINKYLKEMDINDKNESDAPKHTKKEIYEKIEMIKAKKELYNQILKEMKENGETQRSFTDPESRLMKTPNGGFDVCYNAQIVADPKSHIVGIVEVTNRCNDTGLLSPVMIKAKEDFGVDVMEAVADKGFEDKADMLKCLMNGIIPHVPSKTGAETYELKTDYKEAVITEDSLNSVKPDDIRTCLETGVIPNIYKDKGIEASVCEKTERYITETGGDADPQSRFMLNEDKTSVIVICPNGSLLNKVSELHNKNKTRFSNRAACKKRANKCTASTFKQVDLKDGQTTLYTKKFHKVKKVIIKLTPDKEKIRNRKCVVEHPFGTVKRWSDGYYTLLKGKEKVCADLSLL